MQNYSLNIRDEEAYLGKADAPLILIEYGDYECPYSRLGYRFVQKLLNDFDGEIKFIFRHFPIRKKHPNAEIASEAALSAGSQGKFWEMHDLLFDNSRALNIDTILKLAKQLDLNLESFKSDLEIRTFRNWVQTDYRSGIINGVDDTPTFFLNEEKYTGKLDLNSLKEFITSKKQA